MDTFETDRMQAWYYAHGRRDQIMAESSWDISGSLSSEAPINQNELDFFAERYAEQRMSKGPSSSVQDFWTAMVEVPVIVRIDRFDAKTGLYGTRTYKGPFARIRGEREAAAWSESFPQHRVLVLDDHGPAHLDFLSWERAGAERDLHPANEVGPEFEDQERTI